MELDKIPQWLLALEPEDVTFLKNFVLKSGSLKEIARLYQVSYPTVRLRLDKLIQKIELNDQKAEKPFAAFIKGLAVDSRIDLETAKLILDKYQSEKEVKNESCFGLGACHCHHPVPYLGVAESAQILVSGRHRAGPLGRSAGVPVRQREN